MIRPDGGACREDAALTEKTQGSHPGACGAGVLSDLPYS